MRKIEHYNGSHCYEYRGNGNKRLLTDHNLYKFTEKL